MLHCFCDFDGTITVRDTTDAVLEQFADPKYLEWEQKWEAGEISARECMAQQVRLIRATPEAVRAFVREIPVDPGIHALVQSCRLLGGTFTIVSDGIDFLMEEILRVHRLDSLPHYANHLRWEQPMQQVLTFPHGKDDCRGGCGLCKCAQMDQHAGAEGAERWTVYVGDGLSDRCVVHEADQVFAKGKLHTYCSEKGIIHTEFESLSEVAAALAQTARV
ncbi:MAG: MtnX-like HAD-IB family phosphatase [Nitrospirae bacterium]|nr:MtnX-like HAD-IB family phosphatase [Candidatus Manganitrophaceae bacterium]